MTREGALLVMVAVALVLLALVPLRSYRVDEAAVEAATQEAL